MKAVLLVGVVVVILCGAYWLGSAKTQQKKGETERQKKEEDRLKIERNLQFDDLERAFWPSPVDLKGKNVLVFEYDDLQPCTDACNLLVNGNSGAEAFYALYEHPDAPDFNIQLDLNTLVQGRIRKDDTNQWSPIFEELAANEPKPAIDYVVIQMSGAVAPVISEVLKDHGLDPTWGEAAIVLAAVPDSASFQLNHKDLHYIKFYRSVSLGHHHVRDGTYSFSSGIDHAKAKEDLRKMLGVPP
ncbi:MAG: hypothetical protein ABJN65_16940 [Parasphingorhabdus sp.]